MRCVSRFLEVLDKQTAEEIGVRDDKAGELRKVLRQVRAAKAARHPWTALKANRLKNAAVG
mgnify:CR=1 FL=1